MSIKKALVVIGISIPFMLLIIVNVYNSQFSYLTISNVLFLSGMIYFFPGLLVITNASDVFSGASYAISKLVNSGKKGRSFSTFAEYVEFKKNKNSQSDHMVKNIGVTLFVIGTMYIIMAFILGAFV